jgi:hypothetical protein
MIVHGHYFCGKRKEERFIQKVLINVLLASAESEWNSEWSLNGSFTRSIYYRVPVHEHQQLTSKTVVVVEGPGPGPGSLFVRGGSLGCSRGCSRFSCAESCSDIRND